MYHAVGADLHLTQDGRVLLIFHAGDPKDADTIRVTVPMWLADWLQTRFGELDRGQSATMAREWAEIVTWSDYEKKAKSLSGDGQSGPSPSVS